ncbi:MAG: hypothetical protein ACR2F5_00865 [Candidatus Limnocylindria bacterium]
MSIRLDPRRLGVLKQLAAEADTRPGDLVRIWVEERLDAEKRGQSLPAGAAGDPSSLLTALTERVAALEASATATSASPSSTASTSQPVAMDTSTESPSANGDRPKRPAKNAKPAKPAKGTRPGGTAKNRVAAKPSGKRVALHDEIIAVVTERGPTPAAEIAAAIVERGRYQPPRSGKPLDAATVNARISNPTYRGRFTRSEGRIGLTKG